MNDKLLQNLFGYTVGGVGGAALWKEHRVLGFLAGARVGMAPMLFIQGQRGEAVLNLVSAAAAVTAARMWKAHPVLGFLGAGFLTHGLGGFALGLMAPDKKPVLDSKNTAAANAALNKKA